MKKKNNKGQPSERTSPTKEPPITTTVLGPTVMVGFGYMEKAKNLLCLFLTRRSRF